MIGIVSPQSIRSRGGHRLVVAHVDTNIGLGPGRGRAHRDLLECRDGTPEDREIMLSASKALPA